MTSQPRLHIAKIPSTEPTFNELFATFATTARLHLGSTQFSLTSLWDYAQYLDLADAGYGKKTDSLYAMVIARCRAMLRSHGQSPAVRLLSGKTCSLADILSDSLDAELAEAHSANYSIACTQAAA